MVGPYQLAGPERVYRSGRSSRARRVNRSGADPGWLRTMAELVHLSDPSDPALGDYAALTDPALRKRYENRAGVFIAEGPNPVRELVTSPYPVRSLLVAEERVAEVTDLLVAVDAPVYVVPRDVLYELVRFPLHQGVLGCGVRRDPPVVDAVVHGARRLLVLEGLNDHENLGTLFRSARGLGYQGVLLGPGCADPLYRRSVRVSMGHVLHVPFARVDGEVGRSLEALHASGVRTVALTPDPDAPDLRRTADELGDRPVALLLGAEGPGLSTAALTGAHLRARIPMRGGVDSLNVAAAGAIAMHALGPR
ncbi:MAG: RNA methyltransferase [Nitriliruptor sp.]